MDNLPNINNFIENEIYNNTIEKLFSILNKNDKDILKKYYKDLLIVIYYAFFENNTNLETFVEKMRLNNYKDAVSILLSLLPFINSNENTNTIKSFNEMVTEKYKEVDISKDSPRYKYTNFQYQRCNRDKLKEIEFDYDFLKNNYLFLVDVISKVSNKLYVNWIDVLPHNLIDYQNEKLYINTKTRYENGELRSYDFLNKDLEIDENLVKNLTSLSIADIYETITNEFYYQIKKVKWLIYDITIYVNNKPRPVPLILLLNQAFRGVLQGNLYFDWSQANKEARDYFSENWTNLLNLAESGNEFNNGQTIISNKNIKNILKSFMIFFNNYYVGIEKLIEKKKYQKINFGSEDPEEGEEAVLENIKMGKILRTLKTLDHDHIYNFMRDSFNILKLTWYSLQLCNQKKEEFLFLNEYFETNNIPWDNNNVNNKITIKNIYNYAKSFCHIQYNGKFTPLPRFFQSLSDEQKTIIERRLYDNTLDVSSWFNISRNIQSYTRDNANVYQSRVHNFIKRNLIDYVFESFISRGILSKLVPNLKIEDRSYIPEDKRRELIPGELNGTIFSTNPSNNIWTNSYYYLTNTTYQYMRTMKFKESNKEINYFEFNGSKQSGAWYSVYAIDWTSQINFFNKFINNRVIFTTGSTGVGKSTQVPKLILYAQKAIYYNSTSSIVCTQPRKTPTTKNADTVSTELGVPIDLKMKDNYYVQFKHKDQNHSKSVNHLSLKFVTDGSLVMELKNPILKNELENEPFFSNNKYDIVIIDEAHEHNKNMDIILTIMREMTLYNNTIKLVIVSATMDDDEPIYRRYYRDINDNRMYPLNNSLKPNNLDRINVDRRFHISPPGQTTKFRIDETYINNIPTPIQDPAKLALEIIRTSSKGDVLVFQPGKGEIDKVLEELNKSLPSDVIALPYHSELKEKQRTFIENITRDLKKLHISKTDNFNEIDNPEIGNNNYKRVVIVATNIAEASITIPSLFYVIETGTQKTSYYDFKKRNTKLEKRDISESSRLQRKGRVGRTGPGHVYYLYEKGKMENNKTIYQICIQDIADDLFRQIYNNSSEKILLSIKNDPNNPKNNLVFTNLKQYFDKFYTNFTTYFNIDQYFEYFGNTSHYDYENYENPTYYHEKGYSIYNLNDYDGKFYIVHPEELDITRNIVGTITENKSLTNKLVSNSLESEKLKTFWDTLRDNLYLDYSNKNILKLPIGERFQKLQEFFEFEDAKLFKAFMYSFSMGVTEEVIRLICFLQTFRKLSTDITRTVFINGKFVNQFENLKKNIGNDFRGDFDGILYILQMFHNKLNNLNIIYDKDLNYSSKIYATEISRFLNENDPTSKVQIKYDEFNLGTFYTGGIYISDENYLKVRESGKFIDFVKRSYKMKENEILSFCNSMNLSYEKFQSYFEKYVNLKNKLYLYMNKSLADNIKQPEYKYLEELTELLKKTINFNNFDNYEKILSCFLLSNPYNMASNILSTNNYTYMYEPTPENIYQLSTITKFSKKTDNFVNPIYLSKYLYYHSIDTEGIHMSLVNYVHPKLIENLYRIYNSTNAGKKLLNLIKQDFVSVKEDSRVFSHNYKQNINELNRDYEDNTKLASYDPKKIKDIEKIDLFNKKIREIMNSK